MLKQKKEGFRKCEDNPSKPPLRIPTNCEKPSALFLPAESWIKNGVVPNRNTAHTTDKLPPATQEFPSRRLRLRLTTATSSPPRPLGPGTTAGHTPGPGQFGGGCPRTLASRPTPPPRRECARRVPGESQAPAPRLPGRPPLLPPPPGTEQRPPPSGPAARRLSPEPATWGGRPARPTSAALR